MDNDDVKQQALEQAQQAYGLFIWFVKWFSYVMIFMIVLMFMNNWFDDGTGSMFMPDEIYEDQYDPRSQQEEGNIVMWTLVTEVNSDGNVEYQVSDGAMGERTTSYDFVIYTMNRMFMN